MVRRWCGHPTYSSLGETGFSGNWAIYCGPLTSYIVVAGRGRHENTTTGWYNGNGTCTITIRGVNEGIGVVEGWHTGTEFTAVGGRHLNHSCCCICVVECTNSDSCNNVQQIMCTFYQHCVVVVVRCILRLRGNYEFVRTGIHNKPLLE